MSRAAEGFEVRLVFRKLTEVFRHGARIAHGDDEAVDSVLDDAGQAAVRSRHHGNSALGHGLEHAVARAFEVRSLNKYIVLPP